MREADGLRRCWSGAEAHPAVGVGRDVVRVVAAEHVHAEAVHVDAAHVGTGAAVDAAPAVRSLRRVGEVAAVHRVAVGVLAGEVHVDAGVGLSGRSAHQTHESTGHAHRQDDSSDPLAAPGDEFSHVRSPDSGLCQGHGTWIIISHCFHIFNSYF